MMRLDTSSKADSSTRVTVSGSRVIFAPPRAAWTARRDFPVGRVMPYEQRGTFTLMGRRRTPALKGV